MPIVYAVSKEGDNDYCWRCGNDFGTLTKHGKIISTSNQRGNSIKLFTNKKLAIEYIMTDMKKEAKDYGKYDKSEKDYLSFIKKEVDMFIEKFKKFNSFDEEKFRELANKYYDLYEQIYTTFNTSFAMSSYNNLKQMLDEIKAFINSSDLYCKQCEGANTMRSFDKEHIITQFQKMFDDFTQCLLPDDAELYDIIDKNNNCVFPNPSYYVDPYNNKECYNSTASRIYFIKEFELEI